MPLPTAASPLSECGNCLLIMVSLAFIAGLFIVISAILCERIFRGSLPPRARRVPSVWRQGGTLWIEPTRSQEQPHDLPGSSDVVPLWIQRTHNWFLAAEVGSGDSTEDFQRETESQGSAAPFWNHDDSAWAAQPHVTLQDIKGFFQHSSRGVQNAPGVS